MNLKIKVNVQIKSQKDWFFQQFAKIKIDITLYIFYLVALISNSWICCYYSSSKFSLFYKENESNDNLD